MDLNEISCGLSYVDLIMAASCDHGDESLGSIKGRGFFA
jgi:hypothetical protein